MFEVIKEKLNSPTKNSRFSAGVVRISTVLFFSSCFIPIIFAQVAPSENSEKLLGVSRNQKLANMSAKEFQEIFEQGRVKRGSSYEEVENSLGRPTEVKTGRNGAVTWIYDGAALTGIWGNAGFSRAGRFNYAIIVFSVEGLVTQLRYKHVE